MYSSSRADYEASFCALISHFPERRPYFTKHWDECRGMRAGYERRGVTTFGDRDTNRIESINKYVKKAVHHRTRASMSIRKVQRFAENEVIDSIYLYRRQKVQKMQWHGLEQYQTHLDCFKQYICKFITKQLQEHFSNELSDSPAGCSCQF